MIDAWFARVQVLMERRLFSKRIPETIRARMEKDPQVIEKPGAGEANRTPDPNLGNVIARFKKWLKSTLLSLLSDET